jgi:hypothetical protein
MTARALRVGIVLGGNLVEERTFADAGPITIGQSLRCRLSVPVDGVPHEHTLFVRDQGRLLLQTTGGMTGRLGSGDAITTGSVPIERGARGKLQLGEATILFQEVPLPVKAPRPQLPASVRGTFADRIDRRLAVIVGGSLLVHLAIGAWAWMTDVEQPLFEQPQFAEYRQDTYEIQVPDELPTTQEPGAATPVAPTVQTPSPIVKSPTRITQAPPQMSTSDAERFAQLLTSGDEQPGGRTEMGNRIPGDELDKQIKDIRDNGRTIGNDQNGFRNRPNEGINPDGRPVVDGAGEIAQQAPREEKMPPHRIDLRPPPKKFPPGTDAEAIVRKIQRDYMGGLMRCYQLGLKGDHSLSGKVAVSFTVTETGKIADPTAKGLTSEVDACIATQMKTWRFAIQRDEAGDPTELDYAVVLALVTGN